MSFCHTAYGLRISSNLPLPGLNIEPAPAGIDAKIHLRDGHPAFPADTSLPPPDFLYVSSTTDERGSPNLRFGTVDKYFGFFYADGAQFLIDREGREVWADWQDDYTLQDACTYLMGPIFAFVLRLRGLTCLHASAIAVDGRAIALFGTAGAGKSTTAAAFALRGFPVMSDDVVGLADQGDYFFVLPGYPRINLWPDSVQALFGSQNTLPDITPTWNKRYLALNDKDHRFQSESLPLGAIYVLGDRQAKLASPILEPLMGCEALTTLAANTHLNYLLTNEMRVTEFDVLSRIVRHVPIRRVSPIADPSKALNLCDAIIGDLERLTSQNSAMGATRV